ncbi:MAG: FAD-linked oxidase C-terminal domain-containing protein [Bacteroidota bacterium]
MKQALQALAEQLEGDLHYDELMRRLYATDASVYRALPLAVALPRHTEDIRTIIHFCRQQGCSLIPRTAGTSLAGQCVGEGIVVDVSKYMNQVLEINVEEQWVRVEPGVVRDELNALLRPHGLFFGPNTSTANRCMIGGMVGNNSCGTTSIAYGSTRDHTLELEVLLSDGSEARFSAVDSASFEQKRKGEGLENQLYRHIVEELNQKDQQDEIRAQFPKSSIHRRNTGYAVDLLLESSIFSADGPDFNFCQLLCGSEGTLAFTTAIKIHVDPLPPPAAVLLCAHFHSLDASLRATQMAMEFHPYACELMDKIILDCTKENIEQQKNRFFVDGDPAAVLIVELRGVTPEAATQQAEQLEQQLRKAGLGYAYPKVYPPNIPNVWTLRKAGLGLLANIPGDAKAVACIEDTAVALDDLPAYIQEFNSIMEGFGQQAVYYAHAGAGELHLRPILDLKTEQGRADFRGISAATAALVKRYQGSLSGEHGDGRVRAEFIPMMVGEQNYALFRRIKQAWDPQNLFNPGKIVDAPPMDTSLRDEVPPPPAIETVLDFSATGGFLRTAEKCNGSGDCRKLSLSGGTMCPSYQATRNERDTTRGRANALRELLSHPGSTSNPFDRQELREVMDLCLSCKGCTSECPSNVDMASMKAEFLHQYYKSHSIPLRSRLIASNARLNRLAALWPSLSNWLLSSTWVKQLLGFAPQRSVPALQPQSLRRWLRQHLSRLEVAQPQRGTYYFFCDEFTNFYDVQIGIQAIQLLARLGYAPQFIPHVESGRAHLSKGLLPEARRLAIQNVQHFKDQVTAATPLIGIEPSAILSFRDEYPRLVDQPLVAAARELGAHALLIDEFLHQEMEKGNITADDFTKTPRKILLHGHCHQKALSEVSATAWILGLPEGHEVELIPSGCCGMAGSFGYEQEHYELSMQIGELVLFPALRAAGEEVLVAAPGTSCRHQIADGTGRRALHPVEILYAALRE